MKICPNCNAQNDDSVNVCRYCGAVIQQPQPQYQQAPYQQPPYQEGFNPPYQQQPYQQSYQDGFNQPYQQNVYSDSMSPYYTDLKNEISNVRTLGIISVVFLFFAQIVTIVCSIIGISKGNEAIRKAQSLGDPNLIKEAQDAKTLNKIALIICIILAAIAIIALILFAVFAASTVASGSGSIPDISEFSGF